MHGRHQWLVDWHLIIWTGEEAWHEELGCRQVLVLTQVAVPVL
jgi:hypothetical protein